MRIRHALAILLFLPLTALTGCLTTTRVVPKTRIADVVLNANLDQLLSNVNSRFDAIQTLNASVDIRASTGASSSGGSTTGEVKDTPSFSGYIFLRKPRDLRVLLLLPILRSQAMDMVSDGASFKLYIPPRNSAITGTDEVTLPSQNGLENLRPAVFFDSLVVRGLEPGQLVSLTSDVRVLTQPGKKNELIEEPDYDLEILDKPIGQQVHTLRVIHISRSTLLPYQQDIYGPTGQIVTRAFYDDYMMNGEIPFPSKITIKRPLDGYTLIVTINKLTLNQKLDDDQFQLNIPEGVPTRKMP